MNDNNVNGQKRCIGCGGCVSACPKHAISLVKNKLGQGIPIVNKDTCINCGKCKTVCVAIKGNSYKTNIQIGYIATNKDSEQLFLSSSGGISAAMARKWLRNGGVVCGAALTNDDKGELLVRHILVNCEDDIRRIQGSKYVQSETVGVFPEIKELIDSGIKVLFFGTSCQVASLKLYLGRERSNLLTCDLICHGVIGQGMLHSYIRYVETKEKITIRDMRFRTKAVNEKNFSISLMCMKDNEKHRVVIDNNKSGYYRMFLGCGGYRPCCYECHYANINKPSDLTLGDYYEAKRDYPEFFNNDMYSLERGVSSVIVHTEQGKSFFDSLNDLIQYDLVDVNKIVASHSNLQRPSKPRLSSKVAVIIYRVWGWAGVELFYKSIDFLKIR